MLDRREIDLTAGGMLITNSRKPFVDFCIPTAELQGKNVVVGQSETGSLCVTHRILHPVQDSFDQSPTNFIYQITLFMTKTGMNDQGDKLNVTVYLDQFPPIVWLIGLVTLIAVAGKDSAVKLQFNRTLLD